MKYLNRGLHPPIRPTTWTHTCSKAKLPTVLFQVGSLGLPGTQWAEGEMLDAETQAQGLGTLLWELMERGELNLDYCSCVVMMGLGSGASAAEHFAGTSLLDPKFAPLRDATRMLILVNPFPASVEHRRTIHSLQTLKRVLERGVHHEQLQSLVAALFSAAYLEKVC